MFGTANGSEVWIALGDSLGLGDQVECGFEQAMVIADDSGDHAVEQKRSQIELAVVVGGLDGLVQGFLGSRVSRRVAVRLDRLAHEGVEFVGFESVDGAHGSVPLVGVWCRRLNRAELVLRGLGGWADRGALVATSP